MCLNRTPKYEYKSPIINSIPTTVQQQLSGIEIKDDEEHTRRAFLIPVTDTLQYAASAAS